MVIRKVSKKRHIFAASLAIIIFLIGLSLGSVINKTRVSFLETSSKEEKLDLESLQVQYLFLTSVLENEKNCLAATKTLDEGIYTLGMLSDKLDKYTKDQAIIDEKEFIPLKREYTLAQLRYWIFAEKIKSVCDYDTVTILYFYSNLGCEKCRTQSVILSHLKAIFKDKLLNFAFDYDLINEPMISIIRESYSITTTPTLIINGKKYERFHTEEELVRLICESLKEKEHCIEFYRV